MSESRLVVTGFSNENSADEMANFLFDKISHYVWVEIAVETDGKTVQMYSHQDLRRDAVDQ